MKKVSAPILYLNNVYHDRKSVTKIVMGFVSVVLLLTCIVFPQILLANEGPVSYETPLSKLSVAPDRSPESIQQADPEELRLIALLTSDVEIKSEPDNWKRVHMLVTGYCPCSKCCGSYADGITASNHSIQPGDVFVAADSRYAFGTEMVIPGYNSGQSVEVLDRGGAIKGNHIDLFFHTHQEALEWGLQHLDVLVKVK